MNDPIKITLNANTDAETRMKRFLKRNVRGIKEGLHELHTQKIIRWRKAYEAIPAEETREFPWHNASNLVVPLIAIHSDTLLARVMSAIFKVRPLWTTKVVGKHGPETKDYRTSAEEFLQYVGLEPDELDLYRVYHEWFGETIRLGTGVVKCPWFKKIEDQLGPAGDMSGRYEWGRTTLYDGPRPEKISFENFGIPPSARTIEAADFKYDRIKLRRIDIEQRRATGVYDKVAADAILRVPDRTYPEHVQTQKEHDAGAHSPVGEGYEEWDIYECHYRYRMDDSHFCRCIAWYHERSDTIARAYYFYYPEEIFIAARLFYRDDMFHGYGFCDTLSMLQEEVSEIHNQRRDNMTVANMKMFRVDPDSKLNKGYRTYPSAMLPGRKDDIETMEFGTPVQGEIDSERLTLELAEKRSGVSPPMQGQGAGTNTKRGVYTAMGTLSLLQEGNTRTDLNVTDIRYAHTRLGRLLCKEYAEFGSDSDFHKRRLEMFGDMGDKVRDALEAMRDGKLAIPVYAASASVNREVEKQSDLMLAGTLARHYQMITQMIQQADSPMGQAMPKMKKYLEDAVESANTLMKLVMLHFGYDEVDRLVPDVSQQNQTGPQAQGLPGPTQPPGAGASGLPIAGGGPQPRLPEVAGQQPPIAPDTNPVTGLNPLGQGRLQ